MSSNGTESASKAGPAASVGVDLPSLPLVRPTTAADALEIIQALVGSGGVGVLVVDSLAQSQHPCPGAHQTVSG